MTRRAATDTGLQTMQDAVDPDPTPAEAAVLALRDINAVWASWTSGRLGEEDAMAAILAALTFARENGALQ